MSILKKHRCVERVEKWVRQPRGQRRSIGGTKPGAVLSATLGTLLSNYEGPTQWQCHACWRRRCHPLAPPS